MLQVKKATTCSHRLTRGRLTVPCLDLPAIRGLCETVQYQQAPRLEQLNTTKNAIESTLRIPSKNTKCQTKNNLNN